MTLQVKYKKLENDCFNLLTVDPNPPHDINHFSRFLRLENTVPMMWAAVFQFSLPSLKRSFFSILAPINWNNAVAASTPALSPPIL